MAQTIPERLPEKATQGEHRMFEILKRLPRNVIVYYEPVIDNLYPDFVVILPKLGVLIIEVKDWSLRYIIEANPQSIRVWENQKEALKNHPLQQARGYKFKLMDRFREGKDSDALIHSKGPHVGNLKFPFGSFAILSKISRTQLDEIPLSEEVFPFAHVATSDQLEAWQKLSPDALMDVLARFFEPTWTFEPMTTNQVNIIKAILHPEILLELDYGGYAAPNETSVKVLDLKQEAAARSIGGGHRLLFGVAGSGKTVVLIARAKLISRLNPSARVLVLCFNVPLGTVLADALKNCPTVTVFHFDGWAKSNNVFRDNDQFKDHALYGRKLLAALSKGAPDTNRFDVVLIDEAQDFSAEWFQCVLKAMKDPVNGELLIVGDASQGLYGRRNISWKQLGIQAQGRTRYLEQNYRNTRPILELASLFAVKYAETGEDYFQAPPVDPSKSMRTHGFKPVLLKSRNQKEEVAKAAQVIDGLLSGNWFGQSTSPLKPSEIGVLYPRADWEGRAQIEILQANLSKLDQGVKSIWLNAKNTDGRRKIGEPGIKIMSIHTAKGLQFRAVIMLFSHECPAHFCDTSEAEERCLFYVGLTRPEDFLTISASGPSSFLSEIEASGLSVI